ncbi:hypothetical protein [Streptomyces sp. NPDC089795]|uniref:hypothetical protein n=1 Tax=Streptomyces sp. NPDC089795 TaxID=3155297 RepID=UPI003430A115
MGWGSYDVEDGFFPFADLEDENDAGGSGPDRALTAEGQGYVGLPGATGAIEVIDHVGVLEPAGERLSAADQAAREIDDIAPRLEADQDDLPARAARIDAFRRPPPTSNGFTYGRGVALLPSRPGSDCESVEHRCR